MAQGDFWKMAVAVPLKNGKFSVGTHKECKISQAIANANENWVQYNKTLASGHEIENFLQYGDEILLGPSHKEGYLREKESLIISGVEPWTADHGKIHFRNKDNENLYSIGDSITAYGTGLAGGWDIPSETYAETYVQSEGIKRGLISRQLIATFTEESGTIAAGEWESSSDTGWKLVEMKMHTGQYSGIIDYLHPDGLVSIQRPTDGSGVAAFYVDTLPTTTVYGLYGDWHRGGWGNDFAQRLRIQLTNTITGGDIITQDLLDYGDSTQNIKRKSLLVPFQYYRIGGLAFVEPKTSTYVYDDNYNINLKLYPHRDPVDASLAISTDILDSVSTNVNKWMEFDTVALLESGPSNLTAPQLALEMDSHTLNDAGKNGEILIYLDHLFVEHSGGVNFGATDGCVDFERYNAFPLQDSLQVDKKVADTGFYHEKKKYIIKARFEDVKQSLWDSIEMLLEWQERGYLLNLHPALNDVRNVITGKLKITNFKKDFWHLGYRSFDFEFTEM